VTAIVVEELRKVYGTHAAVDSVSFTVAEGEVLALLGPNGAGKTTTVEILTGHRRRTAGKVRVLGFDPETAGRDYRERIGVVLQSAGFEEEFTVRELVRLQARFYPKVQDPDEVIDLVGLADKRDARTKTLSGGQRRRLDLALGLVGAPELLFLDEPTTGFDPSARHHAWELIGRLRGRGTTVLLTTHYMDEAQHLADRAAVIQAGRLMALARPDELGAPEDRATVVKLPLPPRQSIVDLPPLEGRTSRDNGALVVRTGSPVPDVHALTGWALDHGLDPTGLTVTRPSLEEIYLRLTGEAGDGR
jgi:ABC-type multidrug transport system ATPase subunit